MTTLASRIAVAACVLVLPACGSDDDETSSRGLPASATQTFAGTYEVTAFTENEAGCDSEGPSLLEDLHEPRFVLFEQQLLGLRVLELTSCDTVANCGEKANGIPNGRGFMVEYGFTFTSQAAANELHGFTANTGFGDDGLCTERYYSDHMLLALPSGSVRVESRKKALADRPQEDGVCWANPTQQKAEAASRPCTALTVIEASPAE